MAAIPQPRALLRAFIQITGKDVLKGNVIDRRLGSGDDIEVIRFLHGARDLAVLLDEDG